MCEGVCECVGVRECVCVDPPLKAGARAAKVTTGRVAFGASGCDCPSWAVTVGCFPE